MEIKNCEKQALHGVGTDGKIFTVWVPREINDVLNSLQRMQDFGVNLICVSIGGWWTGITAAIANNFEENRCKD